MLLIRYSDSQNCSSIIPNLILPGIVHISCQQFRSYLGLNETEGEGFCEILALINKSYTNAAA